MTSALARAWSARPSAMTLMSGPDPDLQAEGFTPRPICWRIKPTFGAQSNRFRRLARNLEQDEGALGIVSYQRVLCVYNRAIFQFR